MTQTFLNLVNISITASWLVLTIIILRMIFKKIPKSIICILWALVAVRLIFPFNIESMFSLIPSRETIPQDIEYTQNPGINSGISSVDAVVNPIIQESFTPSNELASMNPIQLPIHLGAYVWQLGIALLLCYAFISYIRTRLRVRERIKVDGYYICDHISSPFILGVIFPKIYLPSNLSDEEASFVEAHEKAHLKRFDHLWKPLGYILLTVYWFNPIIWVGYILLCRDIEYACDEKVVKTMSLEEKKNYSKTLLNLSIQTHYVTACPLAFGESSVKSRIKSVLNYKKPAFWVTLVAIILCVVMAVCFLTNPPVDKCEITHGTYYSYSFNSSAYGDTAYVTLEEDGTCSFAYNVLASFIRSGNYYITETELIIKSEDESYVFDIMENGFVFNSEKSNIRYGDYISDGAIFTKGESISDYLSHIKSLVYPKEIIARYTYNKTLNSLISPAQIVLYEDNEFMFSYSPYSSNVVMGKYELTENELILNEYNKNNTYVFTIDGKSFLFNEEKSTELPKYKYSQNSEPQIPVPDGARFAKIVSVDGEYIPENENSTLEDELYNLAIEAESKIEKIINDEDFIITKTTYITGIPPRAPAKELTYSSLCEKVEKYCHGNAVNIFIDKNNCKVNPSGQIVKILLDDETSFDEHNREDFTLIRDDNVATALFKRYHDRTKPNTCREFMYIFTPNSSGNYIINDILVQENEQWVRVSGVW